MNATPAREAGIATPWQRLDAAERGRLAALPRSLLILLENILAHEADPAPWLASFDDWLTHGALDGAEIPFRPSRILLQDTAGVAVLADLAALRDHHVAHGGAPGGVDAAIPIDLVIDHSVRVDHSGTSEALACNLALEYARNAERYSFFKWAQRSFPRLRVVPPGHGICHQINLEQLSEVASPLPHQPAWTAAQTVIGTDSHTTMVNALGILGWGVGGIEAEMAALGHPLPVPLPRVCLVRLTGHPRPGVMATDIALHVTARLRAAGVVDQIVEFAGDALDHLALADRAAISNMCPEYGATAALFPVDDQTLDYLAANGRQPEAIARYRTYALATGLWRDAGPERRYSRTIDIALDDLAPVMAGPSRPQQLRALPDVPASLRESFPDMGPPPAPGTCGDGAIAIAAITSCTNTANPHLMIAAGLLARKARARGLAVPPWVKTSLAPGSRRIAHMLRLCGLQDDLDALGFHLVGFGCTTCVGNSGDLKAEIASGPEDAPSLLTALLSGNRNFENRIHPDVRANYLASPPLVVAGALAGSLCIDLSAAPLGTDRNGVPVMLADIWPEAEEIAAMVAVAERALRTETPEPPEDTAWDALPAPQAPCFPWDADSAFIQPPPFFGADQAGARGDIIDARALLWLGDNVTTDHISPISRIRPDSPAGLHLRARGVPTERLGGYGDRRANHHVMIRGTFDNQRLDNRLAGATGNLALGPDGQRTSVFDAATAFATRGIPLVVIAGENYGTGSARDWAAKGTALLGIRAILARSFERIHRNNLIAMGVLPVLLPADASLPAPDPALRIDILGTDCLTPARPIVTLRFMAADGSLISQHEAQVDARARSQIALLTAGGLFARLRAQYGTAVPLGGWEQGGVRA
ncbi:aconitate hydratase [Sphingobium sp. SYK-6]|uniref:aconitate hydratase n=1 Tax=Sphingobium sp. (strain NBRC 103272 / SYK-6) TaxID=627192 RepID=UPI0002277060|nr:aconitate hydratase AcnA [Sphingobium sp. SYK-6]BAK65797.1 aconitate hydratase [Sphingobium sp. SYK-6]